MASEGGMKTFNEQMMQMKALLELWETGKPFYLIDASLHSIPRNVSEKIGKLFFENGNAASPDRDNSKAISKASLQSGKIYQADFKETLQATESSNEEKQVNVVDDDASQFSEFADVKMPPKVLKRGWPKGAGLSDCPKQKKSKTDSKNLVPFNKLKAEEKDRLLLECFVSPLTAKQVLSGTDLARDELLLMYIELKSIL